MVGVDTFARLMVILRDLVMVCVGSIGSVARPELDHPRSRAIARRTTATTYHLDSRRAGLGEFFDQQPLGIPALGKQFDSSLPCQVGPGHLHVQRPTQPCTRRPHSAVPVPAKLRWTHLDQSLYLIQRVARLIPRTLAACLSYSERDGPLWARPDARSLGQADHWRGVG